MNVLTSIYLSISDHVSTYEEVLFALSLVHFFIVAASVGQPEGTAPLEQFNLVFDPTVSFTSKIWEFLFFLSFIKLCETDVFKLLPFFAKRVLGTTEYLIYF